MFNFFFFFFELFPCYKYPSLGRRVSNTGGMKSPRSQSHRSAGLQGLGAAVSAQAFGRPKVDRTHPSDQGRGEGHSEHNNHS